MDASSHGTLCHSAIAQNSDTLMFKQTNICRYLQVGAYLPPPAPSGWFSCFAAKTIMLPQKPATRSGHIIGCANVLLKLWHVGSDVVL